MQAVSQTISLLKQYRTAEALEKHLGDPLNPAGLFSFKKIMALDEREIYPSELLQYLHDWNFNLFYIPEALGGKLASFEEMLALGRVIARRDLSIAITDAHTLLGSIPVWISGTDAQKEALANLIRNRKAGCLAVTEKEHGSDLLSAEVTAVKTAGGYLLSGTKWPINKATQTDMLCVLAKTDETDRNSRSLSIFLVEKTELPTGSYDHTDKILTLGIRACDISGIRFHDAPLAENTRIGREGDGLEITLKGFQITRTLCAGLALGAMDTALRTTLRFALERKLYGSTVFELPHAKQTLVNAFTDLLIADCMAIFTARAMHVVPEQLSVLSAIVKYFVPTTAETVIRDLSVILGARFYLRESHDFGVFQKVIRDNAIISLFDGSTIINLHALTLQLKSLCRRRVPGDTRRQDMDKRLADIFCLDRELKPFQYDRLDLFSKGNNLVLQGLDNTITTLSSMTVADTALHQDLLMYAVKIQEQALTIEALVLDAGYNAANPESFEIAKKYCRMHAAVSCVNAWVYNRYTLGEHFAAGEWLLLCLHRLLSPDDFMTGRKQTRYHDGAAARLQELFHQDRLFSIVPFQLGQ